MTKIYVNDILVKEIINTGTIEIYKDCSHDIFTKIPANVGLIVKVEKHNSLRESLIEAAISAKKTKKNMLETILKAHDSFKPFVYEELTCFYDGKTLWHNDDIIDKNNVVEVIFGDFKYITNI